MQGVSRRSLWLLERKANPGMSYFSARKQSISALAILFVTGLFYPAAAQVSPQARTTQTRALSPEMLAIHARAKRPVATAPSLDVAAALTTTSTTF